MFIGSCANFYAINKTTGQLQWSYDIRRDGNQQSFHGDPLVTNDLILIAPTSPATRMALDTFMLSSETVEKCAGSTARLAFLQTYSTQFKRVLWQFSGQLVFRRSSHWRLELEFFSWRTK